ncbi:apoptosis-resistant E3 ubiquitin protein ligase 1 isoform X2 [Folsomia candida]|uniref:apoptosis-resistant E3 ubiquitin protein ligase 1 isoform X2 n=1 Tax=Folsomia candida TaxID=158441 RepID=UPI000B8F5107|nr:apoptosis-resistant E3 ubiquitin protein ligase 1 isoform X2 [Folsomia candida]
MIGVRPVGTHGVVTLVSIVQLNHLTHEFGLKLQLSEPTAGQAVRDVEEGEDQPQDSSSSTTRVEEEDTSQIVQSPTAEELSLVNLNLPQKDKERLKRAAHILRQRLILRLWLDDHGLLEYAAKFNSLGVNSIEDAYWFEDVVRLEESIGEKIVPMWNVARISLPSGLAGLESLKSRLWNRILTLDQQSIWNTWGTMLLVTLSVSGFGAVASYFPQVVDAKQAILQYVSGKFNLANNCKVQFDWADPIQVGQTVSFSIRFYQRGGRPYPICDRDNVLIEVKKDSQKVAVVTEFGGKDPLDANLVVVKFSVRQSGQYGIHIMVENSHVKGSPFTKTFLPSAIDPHKTLFLKQTSTVVCVTGQVHKLIVEPRDGYGNLCRVQDFCLDLFRFGAEQIDDNMESQDYQNCSVQFSHDSGYSSTTGTVTTTATSKTDIPSPILLCRGSASSSASSETEPGRISLQIKFPDQGVFRGMLRYDNKPVQNGKFEIVVLNSNEAAAVQKNVVAKSSGAYYEGKLLAVGSEVQTKTRKVYLSITSKQLTIKEYFLRVLPIRVATFRLTPNTKLQFLMTNNQHGLPTILIDDGSQPTIKVAVKDAKIIVATFTHFLLRNIGGSETFQDKQEHFFKELREFHRKHPRDKLCLKITRENIIESTWKATKSFSAHDFCRNFEISFVGEQGIDWGGLRREWFEQCCARMFEAGNPVGMFAELGDSRLTHPNPNSRWKAKHYEMAGKIIGKCLYESSLGSAYRQMVKAKLSRSFLAQLIGLRVSYKYFEQDDPELYLRKVKFILENDVDGMELTFSEEEYDPMGKLIKTVDLVPDGSKIIVTNENKREYLNALAQYRLATKAKPQVDAFLKGLNEVVPDELLSIFDENELELLMCGTSEYSVTELREHHVVSGATGDFRKVLDWFWTAVANMTEEEKARLLQFTTGCSQLPPGGFRELSPLFQITPAPTFGNLPTAHTCFSQLCLPDYENYESFEKALRIAINEGSEGFGLI